MHAVCVCYLVKGRVMEIGHIIYLRAKLLRYSDQSFFTTILSAPTSNICRCMGPNFYMIIVIICTLGAIELQRTLVDRYNTLEWCLQRSLFLWMLTGHESPQILFVGHHIWVKNICSWVNQGIGKDKCRVISLFSPWLRLHWRFYWKPVKNRCLTLHERFCALSLV